ncbi:MAG TPA: hypothetical protein VF796_08145 [Humisphaera sp.]
MAFFGWWSEQSPLLRYGVAIALILVSTVLLLAGVLWHWGWIAGVILLCFAGPSKAEKNGYRF